MIEVTNLRKTFGDLVAVDGISFKARPGAIFGLLGPNGAGKSTTIGCISGLLSPDEGQVTVFGHDVQADARRAKAQLGIVPQELALYEDLSARENLSFWGEAYGLGGASLKKRVATVLELVGLEDRSKEPVKNFSGGMKRRLNFACGIVHEPRALLLDEPTVGVDPQSRVRLLELVREQAAGGTCVLYTTHYMEEAESLCDELAIVDHGRVVAAGTMEELRVMIGERDLLRLSGAFTAAAAREVLGALDEVEVVQAEDEIVTVAVPRASQRLSEIFTTLGGTGAEVRETTITRPNLESLFIKLTGKELRE